MGARGRYPECLFQFEPICDVPSDTKHHYFRYSLFIITKKCSYDHIRNKSDPFKFYGFHGQTSSAMRLPFHVPFFTDFFQHKDIKCQGYQIDYMESNEMDSTIHLQPPILHFTKKWNKFFIKNEGRWYMNKLLWYIRSYIQKVLLNMRRYQWCWYQLLLFLTFSLLFGAFPNFLTKIY